MFSDLPQQLVYGVALGSVYSLIALGYSMVYGVLEFINFSHGDVFMVGAFVGLIALNGFISLGGFITFAPLLFVAILVIAMAATGVLGVVIERVAYRPLRGGGRLAPLISAIGVSLVLQNGVMLIQTKVQKDARPQSVPASRVVPSGTFELGGIRISHTAVLVFAVSVALMLALQALVTRTSLGRAMRAVAQDPEAAGLMGIDSGKIVTRTFFIGSALAGAAGVLVALYYTQIDYMIGFSAGIKAFAAAVLGGIGNITGAMVGGLVLGVTEALASTLLDPAYADLAAFVILIGVLALRPGGLLGARVVERV